MKVTIHRSHAAMESAAERRPELAKPQVVWLKMTATHTGRRRVRRSESENDDKAIRSE